MPAPDLYPVPFPTLVDRLERELAAGGDVYGLRRRDWWTPDPARDTRMDHFGQPLATPAGPASGPHTQLAQNLVLGWLGGGRFFELKTVQVRDDLVIPRPCIFVPHVGYNVEWSQELLVDQSALEYIKGWMLVHMLQRAGGLWPAVGTIFDISLGYDLAGIRSEKVGRFLSALRDAGPAMAALRAELPARLQAFAAADAPSRVSDTITLSTFHGCPADEIEAIASQTLDWGYHTVVKLNPTLLGHDRCRAMLDRLGYDAVTLDPRAFEADLQWAQLQAMIPRLRARAADRGLGLGVKFSNTLVHHSPEPPFGDGEMYLSGPPLHVLAFTLAAEFRAAFPDVPITFSAGVEQRNFAGCVAAGLGPVTSCSDLLKGGGYGRMTRYVRALEARMAALDVPDIDGLRAAEGGPAATLQRIAGGLLHDPGYAQEQNRTPPKKVGTPLDLLDCLTCDKCIPVCPNAANFAFEVPRGEHHPGRLRWSGGDFALSVGAPLIVAKRHQIGNVADACNLCGQCDPWCPEDGGPYLVKPNLFLNEASFSDHPERDGFLLSPDRSAIWWRRAGAVATYTRLPDGRAALDLGGGRVLLDGDRPVATEGQGDADLTVAVTMRLFLDALSGPGVPTWLPPLPESPLPSE